MCNRLAEARRAAGLTQGQLAHAAEVSRQTIGAIEQGDYNPSTVLALKLAVLVGAPVDQLFWLPDATIQQMNARRSGTCFGSTEGAESC